MPHGFYDPASFRFRHFRTDYACNPTHIITFLPFGVVYANESRFVRMERLFPVILLRVIE